MSSLSSNLPSSITSRTVSKRLIPLPLFSPFFHLYPNPNHFLSLFSFLFLSDCQHSQMRSRVLTSMPSESLERPLTLFQERSQKTLEVKKIPSLFLFSLSVILSNFSIFTRVISLKRFFSILFIYIFSVSLDRVILNCSFY